MNMLDGAIALVTGASSGIGETTALALAARGARVSLVARRRDRLEQLAERIGASGGTVHVVVADITQAEQAQTAVNETVATFGGLDVLINNAGVMLLGPIEGAPVKEWDQMIAINIQGLLYITRAALPHLLNAAGGERGAADVLNVSSEAGRTTAPGMAVYNLTKHGVGAFSDALRKEVSTRHVRVTLIEPGPVATELFTHIRPEILAGWDSQGAVLLQAQDVADAITYAATRPAHVAINELLVRPNGS